MPHHHVAAAALCLALLGEGCSDEQRTDPRDLATDHAALDAAPGADSLSPGDGPDAPADAAGCTTKLMVSAADGVITAPFVVQGGAVLQTSETDLASGGRAEYALCVAQAGDYVLDAVVDAPGAGANSLFVNVDAEPSDPLTIWDIPLTVGSESRRLSWRGSGTPDSAQFDPKVFTLSAGAHTLIVRGREANVSVTQWTLVPHGAAPADAGPVADSAPTPDSGGPTADSQGPTSCGPPAGAHNTGLTNPGALTGYSGPKDIASGTVLIENKTINGTLMIHGSANVTIRNCHVYSPGSFWTIRVYESAKLLIEDSEIGKIGTVAERGIGGSNITARRLSIHHHEDGIKLGSGCLYDTVWVHDLDTPLTQPHSDCLQAEGSVNGATIVNSTLDGRYAADSSFAGNNATGGANSAIILKTDLALQQNVTFKNTYLNGGNYVVFIRNGGHGNPKAIRFENCFVGPDRRYGVLSNDSPDLYWDVYSEGSCTKIPK